ncbi:glycerol-3-phosphate cytidylyltransferase [Thorsellia anophelis]|uniref:Glycerol-3-phosphate cytidylyltransferase n=1 Tax=Thorsellia anophelis DSM 18579 TaxID=1123402 RepID=A0A1I0G072_9GAMM|nr:glycerol-3-phosphate cytidylyltransferase [Thorsellia anophelis]SET64057.1 Glycerol-3-phosphate cytidylyltransferase [Thorsellia anophelis DSM 18579]
MKVLTYGSFDIIHLGHINLLKRAKELGSELFVGLSTDEFNFLKNKKPAMDYANRFSVLSSVKYVNYVFPENTWEQKKNDIIKYKIDILVMGDDWKGKFDFLKDFCEVIYLPRTPDISSTGIKTNAHLIMSASDQSIHKKN